MERAERTDQLFLAMAEELKLPLQRIARQAELQLLPGLYSATGNQGEQLVQEQVAGGLRSIQSSADMTLQLLDSYLLSLRLSMNPQVSLDREPVSLSAVLHDTAHELGHIAKLYGVTLQLHVQGRYEPVLAHRKGLQAALVALGYALIEALPASGVQQQRLQLATHRTKQGIVAGVYGELDALTPQALRQAQGLLGYARQPLVGTLPGGGAGVFIADAILAAMESRLRVGRYMRLPGFAMTLPSSEQLQLI